MNKKTRLIIVIICFILFFTITPCLIMYSLGYRFNFTDFKIVATGGVYIRAEQSGTFVDINSKINKKSSFLSNSVFVQNLLPGEHTILVKKDGYFDYQKNINIKEKEVTKIENITLFKNNISFFNIDDNIKYFSISKNNNLIFTLKIFNNKNQINILNIDNFSNINTIDWQKKDGDILKIIWPDDSSKIIIQSTTGYFIFNINNSSNQVFMLPVLKNASSVSFNPQNSNQIFFIENDFLQTINIILQQEKQKNNFNHKIIAKNILTYEFNNNELIYLGLDGNINSYNIYNESKEIITEAPILLNKNNNYKIFSNNFGLFILENKNLFFFDKNKNLFKEFLNNINDLATSPDGKNILYVKESEIFLNHSNYEFLEQNKNEKELKFILLNKFYENISNVFWLNNNYLILKADNKIKISEIDNRGNINIIDLPIKINNKNYQIYFNQKNKKIYILSENNFVVSERLIP